MLDLFGNEIQDIPKHSSKVFTCLGSSTFAREKRQLEDFYATDPKAVHELLDRETFSKTILEPCVGMGHIASVLVGGGVQLYSKRFA